MRGDDPQRNTDSLASAPPAVCPACRSTELTTASKVVDANTYWRCKRCGEVWNATRRAAPSEWRRGRW